MERNITYRTVNPYTEEVVAEFPDATDAEVDAALDQAAAAFATWRDTPVAERAAALARASATVAERAEELASLLTLEMGKTAGEARAEVGMASAMLAYFAENAEAFLETERVDVLPTSGDVTIVNGPSGIVLAIEPWNGPYYQAIRPFAPNAALGNVVLLKHSSIVPQSAQAIVDAVNAAGLPAGVFTNIRLTRAQTERVIRDPRVRGVTLTGSTEAGKEIAAIAGSAMKKTVMELGGSDAFVVLDDADLDFTLACAIPARLYNAGQICTSSKRFIVVDAVYDAFVERLFASLAHLHPGDPADPSTTMPPLSSQAQADTVKDQIRRAVEAGATATEVGEPVPARGSFVQPTVLTGVTSDNPVFREEIFGPVPMIFRVADEDEAIALANDSRFGLSGTVWTADVDRGRRVASRLDTGSVYVNQPSGAGADVPMGGVKESGYGFELGRIGMLEFARRTVVTVPIAGSASILTS